MSHVHSFAPLALAHSRVLVLGSMPGKASLRAQAYYAHPRNLFWPFMEALFDVPSAADYGDRCARLLDSGVALWDVLRTCTRSSSLDSDIVPSSIVANDFTAFLDEHAGIEEIYFNGAKADECFTRYVLPTLGTAHAAVPRERLPSTSPANASIPFERKLAAWRALARR